MSQKKVNNVYETKLKISLNRSSTNFFKRNFCPLYVVLNLFLSEFTGSSPDMSVHVPSSPQYSLVALLYKTSITIDKFDVPSKITKMSTHKKN